MMRWKMNLRLSKMSRTSCLIGCLMTHRYVGRIAALSVQIMPGQPPGVHGMSTNHVLRKREASGDVPSDSNVSKVLWNCMYISLLLSLHSFLSK